MYINKITKNRIVLSSVAVLITIILILTLSGNQKYNKEEHYSNGLDEANKIYLGKINAIKNGLLSELKHCESGTISEDSAPIILDTNNKMSIGLYMFQTDTVRHYYRILYGKEITKLDATLIALNEEKARDLAKDIIFKDEKGWKNWFNCGKKHNFETKVSYIKSIEI